MAKTGKVVTSEVVCKRYSEYFDYSPFFRSHKMQTTRATIMTTRTPITTLSAVQLQAQSLVTAI